jgi:uncharacterized protein (DUF983 family)
MNIQTIPQDDDDRPMRPAMLRGWRRRCPNCGAGPLLSGYLSARDACPVCGEDFHHQRADDGPGLSCRKEAHLAPPRIAGSTTGGLVVGG